MAEEMDYQGKPSEGIKHAEDKPKKQQTSPEGRAEN